MNILKILDSNDHGGVFICEYQFINEMIKRGVKVDSVIIGSGDKRDIYSKISNKYYIIEEDYKYKRYKNLNSLIHSHFYSKYICDSIIDNIVDNYKCVIFRKPYFIYLSNYLGKKMNSSVYWYMPKSINSIYQKIFYNINTKLHNIIPIANSIYTQKTMGDYCKYYVYPGYQEERIKKAVPVYRKELNIPDESPVYGVAARLHYNKAQDLLIRAFIKSEIPSHNGHLIIAGGPLGTDYHKKLIKDAGEFLDSRIHILGHIDDIASFYSSVDIVVNSRRNSEPFGISIAEAMAYGKPIISYYLGGPSEMIDHNSNGWLVKNATVNSYLKYLNESVNKRKAWNQMGKISKNKSKIYNSKESVSKLLNIIRNHNLN